MGKYGAVIGRFQIPKLHEGHVALIEHVLQHHEKIIIFLGTRSSPPTGTNPLSFDIRRDMIYDTFARFTHRITVCKLNDMISDAAWSEQLDAAVANYTNGEGATFYCGRDNFSSHYNGAHPVCEISFGHDAICAKEIRAQFKTKFINSYDFRAGVIYANQNAWHRQYHTVDMAVIKTTPNGERHLCLIRKPGMDRWMFPGGFCDKGERYAESAARELLEETGLDIPSGDWRYLDDFIIEDWRTRGIEGVDHKTVLMFARSSQSAEPVGSDDAEEAKFISVETLLARYKTILSDNHQKLFECLVKHLRIGQ